MNWKFIPNELQGSDELPSALADGESIQVDVGFSQNNTNINHPFSFSLICAEAIRKIILSEIRLKPCVCCASSPSAKADGNSFKNKFINEFSIKNQSFLSSNL